jgi:hypothetical protein
MKRSPVGFHKCCFRPGGVLALTNAIGSGEWMFSFTIMPAGSSWAMMNPPVYNEGTCG